MAEPQCANCKFREKYDQKPASFLGRLWRWHASWCPGWKTYMQSLPDAERTAIAEKYKLTKFL